MGVLLKYDLCCIFNMYKRFPNCNSGYLLMFSMLGFIYMLCSHEPSTLSSNVGSLNRIYVDSVEWQISIQTLTWVIPFPLKDNFYINYYILSLKQLLKPFRFRYCFWWYIACGYTGINGNIWCSGVQSLGGGLLSTNWWW